MSFATSKSFLFVGEDNPHRVVLADKIVQAFRQERRFNARAETPYKRWKLTDEAWRNREKWDDYALAVNEMVERTSTLNAPWTLIEGNDKKFARLKVIDSLCDRLEDALK